MFLLCKKIDMEYVVLLRRGLYLSDIIGDPGRTHLIENAAVFESRHNAERALRFAIKEYPDRKWYCPLVIANE